MPVQERAQSEFPRLFETYVCVVASSVEFRYLVFWRDHEFMLYHESKWIKYLSNKWIQYSCVSLLIARNNQFPKIHLRACLQTRANRAQRLVCVFLYAPGYVSGAVGLAPEASAQSINQFGDYRLDGKTSSVRNRRFGSGRNKSRFPEKLIRTASVCFRGFVYFFWRGRSTEM